MQFGNLGGSSRRRIARLTSLARSIYVRNNYDGALYLPREIASLFQTSTGTTPVAAVTDPVGFVADTRLGMALGPELCAFSSLTSQGTGWVFSGGVLQKNADDATAYDIGTPVVAGKTYEIRYTKQNHTADAPTLTVGGNAYASIIALAYPAGSYVARLQASANGTITITGTISRIEFTSISVRILEGNHAIQATAAARPTWTNRVNLLTYSGLMSNAAWTKRGTASIVDGQTDPYGGTTGELVTVGVVVTNDVYQPISGLAASVSLSTGVWIKRISTSGTLKVINASGGASGQWAVNMALLPDEYVYLTSSHAAVTVLFPFTTTAGGAAGIQFGNNIAGDLQFLYGGTQQNLGSELSRYQRVTTATDFDTAGFPYYLSFLGTDDSLTSVTGGGGSAGFFWCGVVQPTGGAGTGRVMFSDRVTASFSGYVVYLDTANKLAFAAGNGTAYTNKASTATVDVGTKYLLSVWDDGVNLNLQINSDTVETLARPVVVAGASGFAIGREQGGATFLIANLYPSVYWKGTAGTAAERANAQAYCRMLGGL